MSAYTKQELEKMISDMENASGIFYRLAQGTNCHTFIEFTGLMNEYIKLCRQTLEAGVDFLDTNKHTGDGSVALVAHSYNIHYLFEKLECIYGPTITQEVRKRLEAEGSKKPRRQPQAQSA
jgi:hypothetical protein